MEHTQHARVNKRSVVEYMVVKQVVGTMPENSDKRKKPKNKANKNAESNGMYFKCKTLSLLHILGKRWTVDVIEMLDSKNELSFNEILRMLNGVTPRALSNILSDLLNAQVIQKTKSSKGGVMKIKYSFTDKGKSFEQFIQSGKKLGVDLYSIDASCIDRKCSECSLNALHSK